MEPFERDWQWLLCRVGVCVCVRINAWIRCLRLPYLLYLLVHASRGTHKVIATRDSSNVGSDAARA